jgi:hypothetical protein
LPPDSASQDDGPVILWDRLHGEREGWLAIFSGERPPRKIGEKKKDLQKIEEEYFRWPQEKEKAMAYVREQSERGRNV